MKPVAAAIALACCLAAGAARAVDVPAGYLDAMRWYERAAAEGTADAQFLLGRMYETGQYRRKDLQAAADWYRKAADQGHRLAQYRLGQMHHAGIGVARDPAAARQWFEKAAAQGLREAQFNLGYLYERGDGVERSPRIAAEWYRKAAEQGLGAAQYNLGVLLAGEAGNGGLPVDIVEAWAWLSLAAENGVAAAAKVRDAAGARMAPAELARARARLAQLRAQAR